MITFQHPTLVFRQIGKHHISIYLMYLGLYCSLYDRYELFFEWICIWC